MARRATGLRVERPERRQTVERARQGKELEATGEPDRESWALYLLDREFYGLPPAAHGRTPASQRSGRRRGSS